MEKNSIKSNTKKPIDLKKLNPIYNINVRPATSYQPNYFFGDKKMYDTSSLDFDVVLNNGVTLQRKYVWTLKQKQELIISMLCGTKLPPIYVILFIDDRKGSARRDQVFKIVDGKQRLSTIRDFMEGKFGIPYENELYFFNDFDKMQKYQINCYNLDFHIVYEYQDALLGDEVYIKLFNFVNFGGTPQERKHMDMLEESLKN